MKKNNCILMLFIYFFCFNALVFAQNKSKIVFYTIKGSSGIALTQLFDTLPQISDYSISMRTLPQADILAGMFMSGEAKIGVLPPNMAAKIASSNKKLQIAAILGTGMLSLLTNVPSVSSIEDLKGRTVETAGQGATPDFVFRKILQSKSIVPGRDIHLGYALAYPEMALALAAGRIQFALLPEPFSTLAKNSNNKIYTISDIQEEWRIAISNEKKNESPSFVIPHSTFGISAYSNYPMTVLVIDRDFAAANSKLINEVLKCAKDSIEWVVTNPKAAGALAEKNGMGFPAHVVEKAIPASNYTFIPLPQARESLDSLFSVFLEFAPQSIGGFMPKDDFYFYLPGIP